MQLEVRVISKPDRGIVCRPAKVSTMRWNIEEAVVQSRPSEQKSDKRMEGPAGWEGEYCHNPVLARKAGTDMSRD